MSSAAEPRRRTAARRRDERPEEAEHLLGLFVDGVREPRDQQGVDQRDRSRDTVRRCAVQPRAAPALSGEQLVARGVVHGGDRHLAVDLQSERRAEDRKPVREVGRAVDRIEDPEMARGWPRGARRAELLAEHVVIGDTARPPARGTSRSIARSTSVTRSITPFFRTLNPPPTASSCIRPASRTASMAVARKGEGSDVLPGIRHSRERRRAAGGGREEGLCFGAGELLDHPHFHAALRRCAAATHRP